MNEMIGRGNMNVASATEESKKIAEVQGKMILAMRFPRNVDNSMKMIEYECQNADLAEKAIYEFPRGDSVVRGASIRLVECVARHWGNLISGVRKGERTMKQHYNKRLADKLKEANPNAFDRMRCCFIENEIRASGYKDENAELAILRKQIAQILDVLKTNGIDATHPEFADLNDVAESAKVKIKNLVDNQENK